jgi:hypothetical protein
MDMSQLNMNDPQIQALIADYMRKQQQGGGAAPGQVSPLGTPIPPQPQQPPPPTMQSGPALPPPGATPPPGAMQPPGAPPAAPGGPPGAPGGQLSPELVEGVIGLQGQAGERKSLDRQYALADAMRAQGEKGLQQRIVPSSTGGMVVAPNLASGLAAVGTGYMANRREREADKAGSELDRKRQKVQGDYFAELTGQLRNKRNPRDDLGGWGTLSDY